MFPQIAHGDDWEICKGETVNLAATGNFPGDVVISWNNAIQDGIDFVPDVSAEYIVTVSNDAGEDKDTVLVTVLDLPVSSLEDIDLCQGESVILSGEGGVSYTWDQGVIDGVAFTPVSSKIYTVDITAANGCMGSDDVIVSVFDLPEIGAGVDQEICKGLKVTISASGEPGATWDNGVIDGEPFVPDVTMEYIASVTDADGCSNKDTVLVTVNDLPLPTIDAGVDQEICDGESVTLTASSDSDFAWDNGITDNVGFIPATSSEYIATATNNNGCWNKDTVLVTVHSIPTAQTVNVSGPPAFCDGESVELSVAEETDMTYQWMEGESEIENQVDFKYSAASSGNYKLKISSSNGCLFETLPTTVLVYPVPENPLILADGGTEICEGDSVKLSVTHDADLIYQWKLNDADIGIDSSGYMAKSSGSFTLEATNSSGCTVVSLNSMDVLVIANPAVPTIIVNGVTPFCPGDNVEFSVTNDPLMTYQWMNGETIVEGEVGNSFVAEESGNYKLRIANTTGCTSESDVKIISTRALPVVDAGDDEDVCKGESVSLTATGDGTITWDMNVVNGVAFIPLTNNEYHASTVDANGCTNADTVVVTVHNSPEADLGDDEEICMGGGVSISATGYSVQIWPGDIENGVIFYPEETKDYWVRVETEEGCSAGDTIKIVVHPTHEINETRVICESVKLNWRGQELSETGTYTDSQSTIYGCDSIFKINLTVSLNPASFSITGEDSPESAGIENYTVPLNTDLEYGWDVINGSVVEYEANNIARIQWGDPGDGAVYVVAQNTFGCLSETSSLDVQVVPPSGIMSSVGNTISIYPNPLTDKLYVELNEIYEEITIRILDITGSVISEENYYQNKNIELRMDFFNPGIYFINIWVEEESATFKVVKEI